MATQPLAPSTVTDKVPLATGLPRSISTGAISSGQTSSAVHIPPQTQTSNSPVASASDRSFPLAKETFPEAVASNRISLQEIDPFSRLSPQATGGIVFAGTLLTVLCLAVSFVLLRRKARDPSSKITECETQSTLKTQTIFGSSKKQNDKPRPSGFIHQTSTSSSDSSQPPFPVESWMECLCRMTYVGQTSTSPPWSIFLGRGSSSIVNWKPHDGRQTPLRLSSDTCMILDPWLMKVHQPLPPLPP